MDKKIIYFVDLVAIIIIIIIIMGLIELGALIQRWPLNLFI